MTMKRSVRTVHSDACYVELNRDARQFTTSLNRHLHVMREHGAGDADRDALDEAKNAHRDRYPKRR